jgi:uncharacterized membrane protein YdjX (TVP38/TMEM64 family)
MHVHNVLSQVRALGLTGAFSFVTACALATLALVPASILTLDAGAVYRVEEAQL